MRNHRRLSICRETWPYLVVFGVVLGGAMSREVNLLFVLAGMILGPLVLNAWWVATSLRRLAVRRKMPRGVCAGDLLIVQVELENARRRGSWAVLVEDRIERAGEPPIASQVYFPYVGPGQACEAAYRGRLARRGRHEVGPFRVSTRFPFGLVRWTLTVGSAETLIVYPRLGRLARGWIHRRREAFEGARQRQQRHSRVEGEFFGVRYWRQGDSRRSIHWRSSARRGGLVVRQFEQPHSRDVAVLVDLWLPPGGGQAELDRVELAVSLAATVVSDACRRGGAELLLGTTATPQEWTSGPASAALLQDAMERLALAEPHPRDALALLLTGALERVSAGADVILVSTRSIDLDDAARFGRLWRDAARRSRRRQVRLVDVSNAELKEFFEMVP